jgi:hypothetical protein
VIFLEESGASDLPALNRPVGTALSLFVNLAILARLLSVSPSGTKQFHGTPSEVGVCRAFLNHRM